MWVLRTECVPSNLYIKTLPHNVMALEGGAFERWGFPGGSGGKEPTCDVEDLGSIPGLGRSPGGGHGYPLQYSCLENPMNRGAWRAAVHVSQRVKHCWASNFHFHIWGGVIRIRWTHESGAFMNGINVLLRVSVKLASSLCCLKQ